MFIWFLFRSHPKLLLRFSLVLHDSNYWYWWDNVLSIHMQCFPIYGSYLIMSLLHFPLCFSLIFVSEVLLAAMLMLSLDVVIRIFVFFKIFKNFIHSLFYFIPTIIPSQMWQLHNSSLKAFSIFEFFPPTNYSWMEQIRH